MISNQFCGAFHFSSEFFVCVINSVYPDKLASDMLASSEASLSGSTLFSKEDLHVGFEKVMCTEGL